MTYVDAACAPLRKTGQIKVHGPAAFEGMRKAGRLAAECLDMLVGEIKPGVSTDRIDRLVYEFGMDHDALPATLMYRGYRKATCTSVNHVVCHGIPVDKPLRDGDIVNVDVTLILDELAWRFEPHVCGRRNSTPRRAADRSHLRGHDAGHRRDQARRHDRRYRPRDPDLCGGAAYERGARFLRPRRWPAVPRRAEYRPCRPARRGHRAQARHVLHGRADDQSRPPACEGLVRWLDRGDARPFALRAVRAHGRRDRYRRRDFHTFATRFRSSRPTGREFGAGLRNPIANYRNPVILGGIGCGRGAGRNCVQVLMLEKKRDSDPAVSKRPRRIITAIASACASAFARPAPMPSRTMSFWSCCCSARCRGATSSRSPKRCIATFGSFAEAISAPEARLAEVKGLGDAGDRRAEDRAGSGEPAVARRGEKAPGAVVMVDRARLLPHRAGFRRPRTVPRAVPRQAQPAYRRRGAAGRHRRSHAGLSARSGQARAWNCRPPPSFSCTIIRPAIRRRRAPTSR